MPYSSVQDLPARIQGLSAKRKRQWMAVYNSAYSRAKAAGKSDSEAESSAFAQANGVIKEASSDTADNAANFEWATPGPVPPPLFLHEESGTVYRGGLTFVPGNYEDKAYSMTPEEIIEAAESFSEPQSIDLEHIATVLDPGKEGRLGQVIALEANDDGSELKGLVALPKWLDDRIGATPRKISASWNRGTKKLEGLALVLNPRIPQAALMAAFNEAHPGAPAFVANDPNVGGGVDRDKIPDEDFAGKDRSYPIVKPGDVSDAASSIGRAGADNFDAATLKRNIIRIAKRKGAAYVAELPQDWKEPANASVDVNIDQLRTIAQFAIARHDTSEGQAQLQLVHDVSARGGAVCKQSSADMASRHEADTLQQIHDLCSDHGAQCSDASAKPEGARPIFSQPNKGGWFSMSSIRERFMAFFARVPDEQLATLLPPESGEPPAAATTAAKTDPPAATAATTAQREPPPATMSDTDRLRQQLAASQDENRRIRAERIAEQAAQFADHFIRGEHKAFPAERDAMIQAYIQAATDDLVIPGSVTFADGKPGSRIALLKATYDSRPANQLTAEQLAPGIFAALANKDQTTAEAAFAESDKPLSADKITDLIRRTTLGQSVLDHASRGGVATTNGTARVG